MLGDRRLREAGLVDQLAADAFLPFDQRPDDPDSGRVPECSGEPGQISCEVLFTPRLWRPVVPTGSCQGQVPPHHLSTMTIPQGDVDGKSIEASAAPSCDRAAMTAGRCGRVAQNLQEGAARSA
jgi:hypothetical protein